MSGWRSAHAAAVQAGEEHYTDPSTGFFVFTELYHRRRRRCCASGCRHCPYQHAGVPEERRSLLTPPFVLDDDG